MSIYQQIETNDKVTGRVRKISDGLFQGDFELTDMFLNIDEIKSNTSGYVEIDETTNQKAYKTLEISQDGVIQNLNLPLIDEIETLNQNEEKWKQVSQNDYFMNVYNEQPIVDGELNENANIQFSISYGNINGYGSLNGSKSTSITKTIYNQYKNILLGPGDSSWSFISNSSPTSTVDRDSFYVINFSSSNLKEKFDSGNLEFRLSIRDGDILISETFRDDSSLTKNSGVNSGGAKVHHIMTGSLIDEPVDELKYAGGTGVGSGEGFGYAYPDLGIIILNPYALSCHLGSLIENKQIEQGETELALSQNNKGRALSWYGDISQNESQSSEILTNGIERNHQNFLKLFSALKLGGNFKSRSTELVPSTHYFIRVKNTDFNYSNNPSFVYNGKEATLLYNSGNGPSRDYWLGRLRFPEFADDPKTYITTVGLYNENNELVAVGKLSVPILKSFDTETLIKVKLDF